MTDKDQTAPQGNEEAAVGRDAAAAEEDWLAVIAAPTVETPAAGAGAGNGGGRADSPAPAGAETSAADAEGPEAAPADPSMSAQARRSAPAWLAGVETAEDSVPAEVQAKRDRMAELAGQAEQLERAAKARLANRSRQVPAGARKPVAAGFFGQPGASAVAAEERAEESGVAEDRVAEDRAGQDRPDERKVAERSASEASSPSLFAPLASDPAGPVPSGAPEPGGQAGPAATASSRHASGEPGDPAPDAGEAASQASQTPQVSQAPRADDPVHAATAPNTANVANTANTANTASAAGAPANASSPEPTGTSALPVVAAAASGAAVVPHTPTPPPVAASTPDSADPVRSAKRSGFAVPAASSDSGAEAQRRSEAREAALAAKPLLARILQTVLAIAYPFLLLIGAIKLVASPWFLWLEYSRPGFPADAYGFSAGERLTYGSYGVDYLNNAAGPEYLGNLVDLSGNPLFLNTEVAHMADVKAVIAATFIAGLILLVAAALIALYLSRRYAGGIRRALFAGAVSTIGLMVVLGVLGTLNWRAFFSGFHSLFFAEGTWTFSLDDTLIRLYPTQFWVDSAISVAGLVLLVSAVTLVLTWPTARRRERSRLRQEARDFGLNH